MEKSNLAADLGRCLQPNRILDGIKGAGRFGNAR